MIAPTTAIAGLITVGLRLGNIQVVIVLLAPAAVLLGQTNLTVLVITPGRHRETDTAVRIMTAAAHPIRQSAHGHGQGLMSRIIAIGAEIHLYHIAITRNGCVVLLTIVMSGEARPPKEDGAIPRHLLARHAMAIGVRMVPTKTVLLDWLP